MKIGDKFTNVHMPNHGFEILNVIPLANQLTVEISPNQKGRSAWQEVWNLEHSKWAFERGEYNVVEDPEQTCVPLELPAEGGAMFYPDRPSQQTPPEQSSPTIEPKAKRVVIVDGEQYTKEHIIRSHFDDEMSDLLDSYGEEFISKVEWCMDEWLKSSPAPTKEPAGEKPMPRDLQKVVKDAIELALQNTWDRPPLGWTLIALRDELTGRFMSSLPAPDPGPLGETPENALIKAVDFALSIRDLWAADQVGTVSADHEGEMQALSKMEEMLKQALLLTPAFTGEKPGPLGRREDVPQEILREELAQAQFERNVAQYGLATAEKRIASLEAELAHFKDNSPKY